MRARLRSFLCLSASLVAFPACATAPTRAPGMVVSPADAEAPADWTEDELRAEVVMRNLRRTPEASFHLLRVRTALRPRKHEQSDLVLLVVAGKVELELGDRMLPGAPGDVIEVPRGTPYGATNRGDKPGVLYLIFTPALDPNDVKNVTTPSAETAWKWNLWAQ
jgi:mannose-6-phosphate isomerase-like protein (cupin superfamily)